MKDKSNTKVAKLESPSWNAALLVCNVCKKRSNGPRGFKAKAVVQEARRALRDLKPTPRIVLTTCLGLCPKGALAVAFVGGGRSAQSDVQSGAQSGAQICAIESIKQVETTLPLLAGATRQGA